MWNAKGRSGYGDTNLDGTYDDVISGISPNGRQYRNEITGETRDLDGWSYWNLRKQSKPEQEVPEYLHAKNEQANMAHVLANGQANLAKYADPVLVKKTSKTPLKNKVLPQLTRYTNLTEQMKEIVAQYNAKQIDINEYTMLMDITVAKRDRAKVLLDKAMALKPVRNDEHTEPTPSHTSSPNAAEQPEFLQEKKENSVKKACTSAVRDCILLLTGSATLLMGLKFLF